MTRGTGRVLLASVLAIGVLTTSIFTTSKQAIAEAPIFTDIKGHWAEQTILKAKDLGITEGFPDGTFRPNDVVRGDQLVTMMLRAHSKKYATENGEQLQFDKEWMEQLKERQPGFYGSIRSAVGGTGFDFQPPSSGYWAKPFIDFMYTSQTMRTFDPVFPNKYDLYQKEITREKASYLLGEWLTTYEGRYDGLFEDYVLRNSGLRDFNDFLKSPASTHRATVLISGLIRGWDNNFYPQRYVTRAEALAMVMRLRYPSERNPYKPDLSNQFYTEVYGKIYMFNDKYKFDAYNDIVNLAKQNTSNVYIQRGNLGVGIYDSKDTYEKQTYYIQTMQFDKAPPTELQVGVAGGTAKYLSLNYPVDKNMPNSNVLFYAVLDYFAGDEKGKEFSVIVADNEAAAVSSNEAVTFTFNNIEYRLYSEAGRFILDKLY